MILADTNIFIEIYRGNADVIASVKRIGQDQLTVSDVTRAELFFGARNKNELHAINKDLDQLVILPISSEISTLAINLVRKYCLSQRLSLPDALIAATAIIHNLTLYTLNRKDFCFHDKIKLL